MDILLDLNIITDLLVSERKGHHQSKKIDDIIKQRGYSKWISASSIDNLEYTLLSEAKRFNLKYFDYIRLEFRKLLSDMKIFTVTGASIRQALKEKDLEDYIIYTNFKRIAPEGIVISNDKGFRKYPDVITPEEFLDKHSSRPKSASIPMLDLQEEYRYMLEDIDEAVLRNIAKAKYILGPEVKELEDKIASYLGVKHCIGVSSGTEALVLSLRALAIKLKGQEYFDRSDEIITTPFTFTATGDAILRAGATPVFVDIDPSTYNIDPNKIREYLYASRFTHYASRVVGIIPVHLYGQSCQMDEIMEIAKEYNLFVVEDVAQAFGASWKGKKLGSICDIGTFSFFPSKNLGGFGDGGMVATNDDEIAELVFMLRVHGGKDKYNSEHIGYKARLDTLQAAVLLAKFKYIDEFNEKRTAIADIYSKELSDINGILLPLTSHTSRISYACHVYHQYTIQVKNGRRDELQRFMKEKGISTMVYYPVPLYKMKVFEGRCKEFGNLDECEKVSPEVLSLPIEPLMKEDDINYVIENIKDFFKDV